MAGRKTVVSGGIQAAQRRPTVPSAHIVSGSRQAAPLAEWLEETVFVQAAIEGMVGLKLPAQRTVEQFDVSITELEKRGSWLTIVSVCVARPAERSRGNSCTGLEKCSAGVNHCGFPSWSTDQSLLLNAERGEYPPLLSELIQTQFDGIGKGRRIKHCGPVNSGMNGASATFYRKQMDRS